jgi:hypothetical protein
LFERRASKHFIARATRPKEVSEGKPQSDRADLKKSEAWLRQKAAALETEANNLLKDAAEFRRLADAMAARADERLPAPSKTRTIFEMNSTRVAEEPPRRRGRPPSNDHPFSELLRKRDSSPKNWAESHGVAYSSVKSWFAPPGSKAARSIPRRYADLIEQELGLAASPSVWKNGISN